MRTEPSSDVLARAQTGEHEALSQVLAFLYPWVRKHLAFVLRFDSVAEEAVQDSMIAIMQALPSFAARASLKTWALTIATRVGRRRARREWLWRSRSDEAWPESIYAAAAPVEHSLDLARGLEKLALKKREAFVLMDVLELTADEAGSALGVPANTAASRCRHARAELQAFFQDRFDEVAEAPALTSETQSETGSK